MVEILGNTAAGTRPIIGRPNLSSVTPVNRTRRSTRKPKKFNKYARIRELAKGMYNAIATGEASYNQEQYDVAVSLSTASDETLKQIEAENSTDLYAYVQRVYNEFLQFNS